MLRKVRRVMERILADALTKKQRTTLSEVVAAAIECRSLSISEMAKSMPGDVAPKHQEKKIHRFIRNDLLDLEAASRALIARLAQREKGTLCIVVDWSDFGDFNVLQFSVPIQSRAVPIYWKVIDDKKTRGVITEDEGFKKLCELMPEGVTPILLADRGFDSVERLRFLEQLSPLKLVVRVASNVGVRRAGEDKFVPCGKLPHKRGATHDFGIVDFCASDPMPIRLVYKFDRMMDEPWILVTNLTCSKGLVVSLYGRRFEVEEFFRDLKEVRFGLQMRGHKLQAAERVLRLLLVAAVAYLIMVLAGCHAEATGRHRSLQSNTRKTRELALWRVGRWILRRLDVSVDALLTFLDTLGLRWSREELGLAC